MKKFIAGFLVGALLFSFIGVFAYNIYENPYKIMVNGVEKQIQGYNIDGYSYFKLRDIAQATNKFNVDFQNDNVIIDTTQGYKNENGIEYNLDNIEFKISLNKFLSSFSENSMYRYEKSVTTNWIPVVFAYNYIRRNIYDSQSIAADKIDEITDLFFGAKFPRQTYTSEWGTTLDFSDGYYSSNNYYRSEDSLCINLANSIVENADGTITVYFDEIYIYGADYISGNKDIYYSKDSSEIFAFKALNANIGSSGIATLYEKNYNGIKTFELISLSRNSDM